MRYGLTLIGIVLIVGLSTAGQAVPNNSLLLAMPFASPFAPPDGSNAPTSADNRAPHRREP